MADSPQMLGHPHHPEETLDEDWELVLSSLVAEMLPSRDDIVRATPAFQAMKCLGRPLRQRHGEFFGWSRPSTRIASFWSHSWHGSVWAKILTLLILNNSAAAAAVSTASVLLTCALYSGGVLPPVLGWCSGVGAFTYLVTLVCWRSHQQIFIDRICISQTDESLKNDALMSLGAFLKCSDAMLVLWDPSYVKRLWCVFELGAFLHSRQRGMKPALTIRPTVLGPGVLLIIIELIVINAAGTIGWSLIGTQVPFFSALLAIASSVVLVAVHLGRRYCRTIDELHDEMAHFSIGKVKSWCCTVDHVDADTGEAMLCDRKVISQCICSWFGSVDVFEQRIRSEVSQALVHQLSNEVFSYGSVVAFSAPVFWGYVDLASHWILRGNAAVAVHNLMRGLTYWYAIAPTLMLIVVRSVYWTRRKQRFQLLECLVSVLVVFGASCLWIAHVVWDVSLFSVLLPEMRIVAGLLFAMPSFTLALLVWRTLPKIPVEMTKSAD